MLPNSKISVLKHCFGTVLELHGQHEVQIWRTCRCLLLTGLVFSERTGSKKVYLYLLLFSENYFEKKNNAIFSWPLITLHILLLSRKRTFKSVGPKNSRKCLLKSVFTYVSPKSDSKNLNFRRPSGAKPTFSFVSLRI